MSKLQGIFQKLKLGVLSLAVLLLLFSCESPPDSKEEISNRIIAPNFSEQTFNILDFGAVADSISDSKPAIDKAIQACKSKGGGKVIIPAGVYF